MVKVGIIGAQTPLAGEIIRILINHPETELVSLYSPYLTGRSVASVHHGLIGENQLNFTDKINPEEIDLLYVLEDSNISRQIIETTDNYDNLKIIVLSKQYSSDLNPDLYTVGLSEYNRKKLVRGARFAYIPSPVVVSSLTVLWPLAKFLLLNSDINIEVRLPKDLIASINPETDQKEIEEHLKKCQNSFNGKIKISLLEETETSRGMTTRINLKNNLPIDEIEKIYDQIYDDHNFTFLSKNDVTTKETEGTQKMIFKIDKDESDSISINVVSDCRMRGGAGDAVHILNLFFGLHEKTGLHLKSSYF